ncbi:hypothetical protein D8887_07705 [Streptococcus sanguinis]|uniref:Uncharacterized protein n=1 Tax=Streptococcus sanguinis TaxID=1305 RepID=A0A3R9HGP9_STRSA|nr:hypothetical protein [Streptococcus sanguinis]RKV96530.1 MAG: hypothetical protein D8H99_23940 [Streptococcus sp.]RSI10319.1 hypothetical protein D8887_07705 [Streptococcus sanguinis]RSI30690.1 hypothetical protein D8877_06195 [Streptococcus sanguinis]
MSCRRNSDTILKERQQAFQRWNQIDIEVRQVNRFEEEIDGLYGNAVFSLSQIENLPMNRLDVYDFQDILLSVQRNHHLLSLDVENKRIELKKEERALEERLENLQREYNKVLN